jgi:hypothetical protein
MRLKPTHLLAVLVLLACVSLAADAQQAAAQKAPVARDELPYLPRIEAFLSAVERTDFGTAFEALQWTGTAPDEFKRQLATALTKAGRSDGHEIIAVRRISPRLHQIYGIIHYDSQPLIFILHPRLHRGAWKIQTVTFTAKLQPFNDLAPMEPIAQPSEQRVAADHPNNYGDTL